MFSFEVAAELVSSIELVDFVGTVVRMVQQMDVLVYFSLF